MKTTSSRRVELLTILGLLCFLLPLTVQLLWIQAFNSGTNQPERVEIYLGYFPSFLGVVSIAILEVLLCTVAIVISIKGLLQSKILWRLVSILTITGCTLLLLLTLFGFL